VAKFSAITAFLGTVKNRFMTYQDDRDLETKLSMAGRIDGLDGVELCYPADFDDTARTRAMLKDHGLGVSAINFRSRRTGKWWRGSFTSALAEERREVTDDLKRAMDLAESIGCDRITTCPLNEGSDYLFEADYFAAFDGFETCLREAARHNPKVRISLEYKINDPRGRTIVGNAGEALALCQSVDEPNVGVTMDIGHSLYAGERPSQAAVMLARANRLFYVHLNDNDNFWDWDMIPGAFNLWDFVEFYHYLDRIGYDDWFAMDIFAKEEDTVETFSVAVRAAMKLRQIADRVDKDRIAQLTKARKPSAAMDYLFSLL
jgi:xylose isomerase